MDQIIIQNLTVFARHGVLPEENRLGQKFVISATLSLDLKDAGKADDLTKTIDYAYVCRQIEAFLTEHTFQLIESCAEQLAEHLFLLHEQIKEIELMIKKPWAPIMQPVEYVGVKIKRARHKAYIALGSNMGEKEQYLQKALSLLNNHPACKVVACSDFITTKPYGKTDQDDFLNGVCAVETLLSPHDLLSLLHETEAACNRVRTERWGPRTLDLDILFYDDAIIQTKDLIIPHIDLHHRRFVLQPLAQIAPYYIHPIYQKPLLQLLEELPQEDF